MKKLQLLFLWILMLALCGCGKKEEQAEIPETGEMFEESIDEYAGKTTTLEFVPFSMHQYVGEQKNIKITEDEVVSVEWITEDAIAEE